MHTTFVPRARSIWIFALALMLVPSTAAAQDAVVKTPAPIFLLPDAGRVPLRTAAAGTRLRVLEENRDWVKVEFHDPQFGPRTGFIEARHIEIIRPELQPMDLSIRREPARPVVTEPAEEAPRQPPPPVARRFARSWIDVNIGVAAAAESRYGSIVEGTLYSETVTFTADYRSPLGAEFDFGGGVMVTPHFGIGISFTGTAHQDNAELGIRIPHPFVFNAHASDSAPTEDELTRSEGSANIQAMFVSSPSDRVSVRLFGGPSYFRIRQEAVSNIIYDQVYLIFSPANEVEIVRYETEVIDYDDGGAWGFHIGGDVTFFFNRVVGLGWFARYSRGSVEVFDPFTDEGRKFDTGGFQSGGGLRLRF